MPASSLTGRFIRPLSLCLILSGLPGCAPLLFFGAGVGTIDMATQERGLKGAATDSQIRAEINGYWFDDNIDLYRNVLLAVQDGRVMVMGYVPTDSQRAKAIELAWKATGVKEVINEIIVGPEPSTSSAFEDVWIATKIRTIMLTSQDFPSNNYSVTTVNGVVYLLGISTNIQEQEQALEICKSTRGVTKVVNHLLLKAQSPHELSSPQPTTPQDSSSEGPFSPGYEETSDALHLTKEEARSYLPSSSSPSTIGSSLSGIHEESLPPPSF